MPAEHPSSAAFPSTSPSFPSLSLPFSLPSLPSNTVLTSTLILVLSLLLLEQYSWRSKRKSLPGDAWTIPLIGRFADSLHPTLENYKKGWDSGSLTATSVFNIFIVMASSNEYTRKILNSPTYAEPCLVASAKQILLPDNWVFLTGKIHADYRRMLNTLFTRKSLGIYLSIQDSLARTHFARWMEDSRKKGEPTEVMMTMRHLNMETSLRVFCGPHVPASAVTEISDKYWLITRALELVNFPLPLPGTKVYGAIQARKAAMKYLMLAANESKKAMRAEGAEGAEVQCLVDGWVAQMLEQKKEYSDREIAMVILSFLFASQDAMTSGLIYGFQHLADHPEVLAKVREEQERVRGGDYEKPLSWEMMEEMTYLRAVVKESLRVKPPVIIVPYKTTKPFPISPTYTVPSSSMLIPSFWNSLHDSTVYPQPDTFSPERWLDPAGSAEQNPKNYLVFGAGPHKCIGNEYAVGHMMAVLGTAACLMEWEHGRTEESEGVQIIATIFPKDGCRLKFTPRARPATAA